MKSNPKSHFPGFVRKLFPVSLRKGPILAWSLAFLLCLTFILLNLKSNRSLGGNIEEFEVGKVADRDVVAKQTTLYEDKEATSLKIEAQERLVPPVFHYSFTASEELRSRWSLFVALAENRYEGERPEERTWDAYRLSLKAEFPALSDEVLRLIYQSDDRTILFKSGIAVLDALLRRGIYAVPETGLERLNHNEMELIRQSGTRIEQERISLRNIITLQNVTKAVEAQVAAGSYPPLFVRIAPGLLEPFIKENVYYSSVDTAQRITDTRLRTEPVMRTIEQGKRIIKKGFVVTEEEMEELLALRMALPGDNLRAVFANVLFLLLLFGLLCYFSGTRIVGRSLSESEVYLVSGLTALYIAGSVMVRNFSFESIPASVVVPTALVMMLPSILISPRLSLLLAMSLPLGAFFTGSFDTSSYIFAVISGVVAAYSLQGAEKRMDLVKAGIIIAVANLTAMVAVLLMQRSPASIYPFALFSAAFNGIASGMLVLGILPPLESALNAATTFRLIELSDLNAPILRRLFTTAPGTYSHSIMVANLAEAACQDIGANPLLARVGAYYHDLGKMENPGYFVENQTDYNCHDDMSPQHSATVIRSHVKLGMEKARQLRLPGEVINIIGEHHGNSVITWFYSKALKQEEEEQKKGTVHIEDYCYPGNRPRSRESAVVMLADMAEAAVRSLGKPTAEAIEKFIQELFDKKLEHGQLAQSELTFKDIETIKNAFVQVLKGYYHSRIEYPKIEEPKETPLSEVAGK